MKIQFNGNWTLKVFYNCFQYLDIDCTLYNINKILNNDVIYNKKVNNNN